MTGAELLSWYCIAYVAAFLLGAMFLLIGVLGMGGDHDVNTDHDFSTDHDQDGDGSTSSFLDFLGVGKCPLSIVLMTLFFLFALVGMSIVIVLRMFYTSGLLVGLVAYPVVIIASFFLTGLVARLIAKLLPTSETYVESNASHVGTTGEAVYAFENGTGFIQVRDQSGTIHELRALNADVNVPISAGDTVVVTDYDEVTQYLHVQKAPKELEKRV